MVVGQISSTISLSEIFSRLSEESILSIVFPEITSLPCIISSPLREDKNPSFSIYLDNTHHIRFIDFGTKTSGGLIDLLCAYWHCTFKQCLVKLGTLYNCKENTMTIKPKLIKAFTQREVATLTKVQVIVRPWKSYDYEYWASYGITPKWLRYAEIYPISHKIITKKDTPHSKGKEYIFPADKYAYCYVERKNNKVQLKVYQPYNTKGYKWCSKMDASVIGLWAKIPKYGDKVVICSSLKDALCLSCNLDIPALCLQGEGYTISQTAITELKRRYKKIFISFDTDAVGKIDAEKLSKETGFINVVPDLGNEKDYSDYFKSLEDKGQFQKLKTLFN